MSDNFESTSPSGSDVQSPDSGKIDAAKQEAADLKDTAATQAKDVLDTAKDEVGSVVGEAKTQAKDLYAQTQRELREQANTQQQRVAGGLRTIGDELGSMASASTGTGVASDLVQQVSTHLSSAATWLGDRDPGSVLTEVKRYARRKPGTFILGAAVIGVAVGRLTRALAANASDEKDAPVPAPAPAPRQVHPDPAVPVPVSNTTTGADAAGTPLYDHTASSQSQTAGEDGYDRPNAV